MALRNLFLIGLIILASCGQRRQYPIDEVAVSADFYKELLQDLGDRIDGNKENLFLRQKRLYVNARLDWEEDATTDIMMILKEEGLDREIYEYGTDFFKSYQHYEKLLDLVSQWEETTGIEDKRSKVTALLGLNRMAEASNHLWDYVQENKTCEDCLVFAGNSYLDLRDSIRAIYVFNALYNQQASNPILFEKYVPLLLSVYKPNMAMQIVEDAAYDTSDYESSANVASVYFALGRNDMAHQIIRKFDNSSSYYQRAEWFQESRQLDSAIFMMDELIAKDSSINALMKKAALSQERGLLYGALGIYNKVLEKDSSNSIARESAQIVGRKIAYLRSLREKEERIPLLNISSKKETENE